MARNQIESDDDVSRACDQISSWATSVAKSKDTKGAAATRAAQLFPGVDFRASARCRKPHDGMVDAALIAAYGVRVVGSGSNYREDAEG